MRIAGFEQDSIVDGPGLRFTVFVQGCGMHCEGCHNPSTWDIDGGTEMPVDDVILEMVKSPLTDGLTLSGGEPFLQAGGCVELAEAARSMGLNVWAWSGFSFEELLVRSQAEPDIMKLLSLVDVLVDGAFVQELRTLDLKWRGSRNQRVINVPESLASGQAVELQ